MLQRGRARARAEICVPGSPRGPVTESFNGAARARARKFCAARALSRSREASTGPRARARGNEFNPHNVQLWVIASTGPRARARGNLIYTQTNTKNKMLQRGRARARAEINKEDLILRNGLGFNGAARARARK